LFINIIITFSLKGNIVRCHGTYKHRMALKLVFTPSTCTHMLCTSSYEIPIKHSQLTCSANGVATDAHIMLGTAVSRNMILPIVL
jgi:hypothetical protein